MKHKIQIIQIITSVSIVLILLSLIPGKSTYAFPPTNIDTFNTTQTVSQTGVGTNTGTADGAGEIIATERDVVVTVTGGTGVMQVDANNSIPGSLAHSQAVGVFGTSLITYDGNDNDALTLAPNGLGGLDLTTGGDTAFVMVVRSDDVGGNLTVRVYSTDATTCSSFTINSSGGITSSFIPRAFIFPYAGFTQDVGAGCTAAASLTNVGAIQLFIDGTATEGRDVTIDLFETAALDYGDLPDFYGISLLSAEGAAHVRNDSLRIGTIDTEIDGQESINADGDDLAGSNDDVGVTRGDSNAWTASTSHTVNVEVVGDGCLSAWIDWNNDGLFNNTGNERVRNNVTVTTGTHSFTANVPAGVSPPYYSRWRLFPRLTSGACPPIDTAITTRVFPWFQYYGGEVEDYLIETSGPTAVTLTDLTARSSTNAAVAGIAGLLILSGAYLLIRRSRKHAFGTGRDE